MNAELIRLPRTAPASPAELIGLPYTRGGNTPEKGFDCFTLMAYVRWHWFRRPTPIGDIPKRHLPPAALCALTIRRTLGRRVDEVRGPWERCEPHEGCAVALAQCALSRFHHCGVFVDGGILHALDRVGVCFTPAPRIRELFARVEFYECRD